MNHVAVLLVAGLVLAFGTISRRIEGTVITSLMIFTYLSRVDPCQAPVRRDD